VASGDDGVVALLERQTQQLMDAVAPGDVSVWQRLLDERAEVRITRPDESSLASGARRSVSRPTLRHSCATGDDTKPGPLPRILRPNRIPHRNRTTTVVTYGDEIEERAECAGLEGPCFVVTASDVASESLGNNDDFGDHCEPSSSSAASRHNLGRLHEAAVIALTPANAGGRRHSLRGSHGG
jgi:hypothetical protein